MSSKPDLPDGFDDAPRDVQLALLESYQGRDLVAGICDALDVEPPRSSQLRKSHKARVYLALREEPTTEKPRGEVPITPMPRITDDADDSPTPAQAVGDGGVTPAMSRAPDTVTPVQTGEDDVDESAAEDVDKPDGSDDDLVDACPECGDSGNVYARETKPEPERWRCGKCEATFPEPNRRPRKTATTDDETHECDACGFVAKSEAGLKIHQNQTSHQFDGPTPPWLARNPNDIVSEADTTRTLPQVIEAVSGSEDVRRVTQALAMVDAGQCREEVLQPLGLLAHNGKLVTDDLLDERLSVISEWVDE